MLLTSISTLVLQILLTGATQLVDQVNHNLHSEYPGEKDELFTSEMTIACEGFVTILGNVWDKWATREKLVNAAKRVGISEDGLDAERYI